MARRGRISLDMLKRFRVFSGGSSGDDEKQSLLPSPSTPPADFCLMAYFILYIHGIGHLLPWNFFITAYGYFSYKFKCPTNSSSCTSFSGDFENYFSVAAMLPIFSMAFVNIWLQSKVHYKWRMLVSLVVTLLLFMLTTAFVGVDASSWVDGFFGVTLVTVVLMNVSSAVFQSSTFGFAGILPPKYTSVVMSGQACAGVFAAIASILSIAGGHSVKNSAFGYFASAVFIIAICLLSFFVLMRLKFVRYYMAQTSVRAQKTRQKEAEKASAQASINAKLVDTSVPYTRILTQVWVHAVAVFLVFTVTLSLFPAVISSIHSTVSDPKASSWTDPDKYFPPLICFLLFNCSDFVGRYITHWITVGSNRYVLLLLSILRSVFIPLFLLCNARPNNHRHIPLVFNSDVYPVLFTILFGVTNGYISTLCMVFAPQQVPPHQRETASTIMAFFLSAGLLAGGALSFGWTHIITL